MGGHLSVPELSVHSERYENDEFKVALHSVQGYRLEMEDSHVVMLDIPQLPGWSYFGVFDGHAGDLCSKEVSQRLPRLMFENEDFIKAAKSAEEAALDDNQSHHGDGHMNGDMPNGYQTVPQDLTDCINKAYIEFDNIMRNEHPSDRSGSTGTCILISPHTYYFINLGDSRSILCGNTSEHATNLVFETQDHKPQDVIERTRIQNAGGEVSQNRVNSLLAVSRAFGDFDYKDKDRPPSETMVSVIPVITAIKRHPNHTGIICACDGLWDLFSSHAASLYCRFFWRATEDLYTASKRLMFSSLHKGSKDNISVIGIQFKKRSLDLYDPDSDEANYLQSFTQHVLKQCDFYINNCCKPPKYDWIYRKKFVVREALNITNSFMRMYCMPHIYQVPGGLHRDLELMNSVGGDSGDDTGNSERTAMETREDFLKSCSLFDKHKDNVEGHFIASLGPDIFFEDVQQKAEIFIDKSVAIETANNGTSDTSKNLPSNASG